MHSLGICGRGQGSCLHQSEFSSHMRWAWSKFLSAPIRVQFAHEMGMVKVPVCTNQSSVRTWDGHGQGSCLHQSEFSSHMRWAWSRFLFAPIRVQFPHEMGVVKVPVCTNQSSVYAGGGGGWDSCMHQSEFSLCRRWAWLRFLYAPIRVQFMQEVGVAEVPVCTNQGSARCGQGVMLFLYLLWENNRFITIEKQFSSVFR